jgi:chitinase
MTYETFYPRCFDAYSKKIVRSIFKFFFTCTLLFAGMVIHAQPRIVGYIPNDLSAVIDYDRITHLNLAFENPDPAGNLSYASTNNTYIQQAHAKGKKVLVSLAGGASNNNVLMQERYFDLISDAKRADFISKIVSYLNAHQFDGVDIDLEGGSINADYGKFILDLSVALKPAGKLLTAALSHANGADRVPDEAILAFDFINIMAYDATGPWNPDRPGQHSSMAFAIESLTYWINRGLPKDKAVLGVPFYGYGFGTDFNEGMSYAQIIDQYPGAESLDMVGNTIYYNGSPTIKQKSEYVLNGGYGGIMIWQLAQDATGAKSLLRTIYETLNSVTSVDDAVYNSIELYPNPVDSTLSVSALGLENGPVDIIDLKGNKYVVIRKNTDAIDVSALGAGTYILTVTVKDRMVSRKFIKR